LGWTKRGKEKVKKAKPVSQESEEAWSADTLGGEKSWYCTIGVRSLKTVFPMSSYEGRAKRRQEGSYLGEGGILLGAMKKDERIPRKDTALCPPKYKEQKENK